MTNRFSKPGRLLGLILLAAALFAWPCLEGGRCISIQPAYSQVNIYHVAVDGSDPNGDGSISAPWKTLDHALNTVPDVPNLIIVLGVGTHLVEGRIEREFSSSVAVRANQDRRASLAVAAPLEIAGSGITLSGLDIHPLDEGVDEAAVQPTLLRLTGSDLRLSSNLIRGSVEGARHVIDLIEIGAGAKDIVIEGNAVYDPGPAGHHIRIGDSQKLRISQNLIYSTWKQGLPGPDPQSLHGSSLRMDIDDAGLLARETVIEGNVFSHWAGQANAHFIEIGQRSSSANVGPSADLTIQSNLLLGSAERPPMDSALAIWAGTEIEIRANTVRGQIGEEVFGLRMGEGLRNLGIHNNIWAPEHKRRQDIGLMSAGVRETSEIGNNLYWHSDYDLNTSKPEDLPAQDPRAQIEDPKLLDVEGITAPLWDSERGQFEGAIKELRDLREHLIRAARTDIGGAAIDRADGRFMPLFDITGRPRGVPDIGALEHHDWAATPSPTATDVQTPSKTPDPIVSATPLSPTPTQVSPTIDASGFENRLYLPLLDRVIEP